MRGSHQASYAPKFESRKTRTLVHRTPSETPASWSSGYLKMAKKRSKGIPLRAFFGHFSGSRSPRCGGVIRCPMHHLSSHVSTRKMVHRTSSETPSSWSSGYPKMAIFAKIAFSAQLDSEDLRAQEPDLAQIGPESPK